MCTQKRLLDQENLNMATKEMLSVSPKKPLGSLELGIVGEKIAIPQCIHDVPPSLIEDLMKDKDIYILSFRSNSEKEIASPTKDENKNIIVLDYAKELKNHVMVFHMKALKDLLKCNERMVLSLINREIGTRNLSKGNSWEQKDSFKTIDDSVVIAFVELVCKKDFSTRVNSLNRAWQYKALVDAVFADSNLFFQNDNWRQIKLTKEVSQSFIQVRFPGWVNVNWAAIVKEYNEAKAWRRSGESKQLIIKIDSCLKKGHIDLHTIDEINKYITENPDRRLSQIICSKIPGHEPTVYREMRSRR